MFPIKPEHVRRVSFASKLYPRINSALGVDTSKLKSSEDKKDVVFAGGRSKNRDLLTYFGCIADTQKGASTFAQLPLFRRSLRKLVNLVEQELELVGAHETLLPTVIPLKLWEKSKRLERQKDALNNVYMFKDKSNKSLLLGPTYEESITQLVGDLDPPKESELPLMLYQTSSKFRYEPNPRFGLLRSNEFFMNDLYSFDVDIEQAKQTYEQMTNVYDRIFSQLDLKCLRFESVTGSIGGKYSHEYQLPLSSGEDHVMRCTTCDYSCNAEMYQIGQQKKCLRCNSHDMEQMQTLELAHTFLLSDIYSKAMSATMKCTGSSKATYYEMGCYGLGLTRIIGAGIDLYSIVPNSESKAETDYFQLRWPSKVEPFTIGIVAPAKRSKQYQGGSTQYIQELVSHLLALSPEVDILVEDREKDSLHRKISKFKSLGVPNIIVIGQKFLQETPVLEFLKLDSSKETYQQHWMTRDQVCDLFKGL